MYTMVPANLELINNFRDQTTAERLRILISFVLEYIPDEKAFVGRKTRSKDHPVLDFLHKWAKSNDIELSNEMYAWGVPVRKLQVKCPQIINNLSNFINESWVWISELPRVDLRALHNAIYNMYFDNTRVYIKRIRGILRRHGYSLLGNGAYSEVWGKEGSEWVYKINGGCDDGWCEYVAWATERGYNTTYAPRVHALKKYNGFYIAKMQRYSKTLSDFRNSAQYDTSREAREEYRLFDIIRNYTYSRELQNIKNAERNKIDQQFPGLIEFLADMLSRFNSGLDLHDGNFMIDKNGFLVVTDPIVHSESTSRTTRIRNGVVAN